MIARRISLLLAVATLAVAAPARADGPPQLVKDLVAGQGSGSPHDLTAYKDRVYFTGTDGTFGIFRSDGTDVTLFKRADSGGPFAVAGDTLYFGADHGLWRSDGGAPVNVPGPADPGQLTPAGSAL